MCNGGIIHSPGRGSMSTSKWTSDMQSLSFLNTFISLIVKDNQSCLCPVLHFFQMCPTSFIYFWDTGVNGLSKTTGTGTDTQISWLSASQPTFENSKYPGA